jgi:hypothetical protein
MLSKVCKVAYSGKYDGLRNPLCPTSFARCWDRKRNENCSLPLRRYIVKQHAKFVEAQKLICCLYFIFIAKEFMSNFKNLKHKTLSLQILAQLSLTIIEIYELHECTKAMHFTSASRKSMVSFQGNKNY